MEFKIQKYPIFNEIYLHKMYFMLLFSIKEGGVFHDNRTNHYNDKL